MSNYQPKVGDKVMVGKHGPYEVAGHHDGWTYILGPSDNWSHAMAHARTEWLTPAPEPEPDEPPAPGALVRFGNDLAVQRGDLYELSWLILTGPLTGSVRRWDELTAYPITVILADPAEVERLRTERDEAANELAHLSSLNNALIDAKNDLLRQRDELQRRTDRALNELTCIGGTVHRAVTILRGES